MTTKAQQITLDDALIALENRRVIGKCNMRINPGMKPKKHTYQVVLDALALTTCYHAFLITAEIDNKRFSVNVEVFRDILNICPRIPGQEFDKPLTEEEALSFIRELGHFGEINYITDVIVDHLHQTWRTFASIIIKCLCGKIDNKDSKKQDKMFYPRFTKIIIHHFLEKDKSISMRNRMFMHTARDDSLLRTMRFVSRHEDAQIYGATLPRAMTNQAMLDTVAYKTYYAIASGAEPLKSKKPKMKSKSAISSKEAPSKKRPTKAKKDTSGADEGTGTKPGVPDVPKYLSESKNKLWGDSDDDESNDDNSDEVPKDDDEDDVESDANDHNEASDSEKTESDKDENLNLNPNDDEEEEKEEDDIRTPGSFEFNDDDEEYDELYKDVNVRSKVTEQEEAGKGDAKMTDTTHESPKQSFSVSSDFVSKFLNLDNVSPIIDEVASMMNVKTPHEESSTQAPPPPLLIVPVTAIPKTSTVAATTVPPIIQPFSSIPQMTTPTPVPTIEPTPSSIPNLPDFASLFGFDQRVSALEQDLSQVKQSYTAEFKKKAQAEKEKYIDIIEKSVKEIIKDEVKIQLSQILPKEISDFATPVIQSTINKSLENVVLAKSSSQPQSTYEAAASLTEFELKKILLDKLEKSKSYQAVEQHRDLYDTLVKSYQLDKDLFDSYGKSYSLKRGCKDKDIDEDLLAGLDQGLKKRKTSKDAEPSRGSKSKEYKSSSSKGSKSQSKSSSKSAQAEEPVFETADTEMPQDQGDDMGNTDDQPNVKEASKHDWFKKPEKPPTPDRDWNDGKQIDFRPPQTWISKMAKTRKPPTTFDELMRNPVEFSAYVLYNMKIENLTQEHLCYKAVNDKLDWHNPEGHEYPFDLSKPLPLIEDQGRQVVHANYFFNNDLEYLKGGSYSRKYTTSTTKTKAAKYANIEGIEDMVQTLWSLVKVTYDKHAIWGTSHWDHKLCKFKEGDFSRLNMRDIKDMLLLLVRKNLSNLEKDDLFYLNVALRMFTRRVVILKRVEDLHLGVKSYQKKLNITKPETFRSDITNMSPYTAYNDPQGIIYQDKLQRNKLMRLDELYKFCDGTLSFVRLVLHDIAYSLEMNYLLKRVWSKLDRKRSRIMIKAIDQQLFERRLMRNLEKFVGGREYRNDFRLLERTI
ncbi:hypothetical protein Tco_0574373 [Tanacetum coccineum]